MFCFLYGAVWNERHKQNEKERLVHYTPKIIEKLQLHLVKIMINEWWWKIDCEKKLMFLFCLLLCDDNENVMTCVRVELVLGDLGFVFGYMIFIKLRKI